PPRGRQAGAPADPNLQYRRPRVLPNLTFKVAVTAGTHLVEPYVVNKTTAYVHDLFDPLVRLPPYRNGNGASGLSRVTESARAAAFSSIRNSSSESSCSKTQLLRMRRTGFLI